MNDEQLFEKVGERIQFFAGGYAYGLIGEANIAWLKDQSYGDVFWYGDIYRLGPAAAFDAPKIMSDTIRVKLRNFLDDTNGLQDYPLMDDSYYSDLMLQGEDKWYEQFGNEYNLDPDVLVAHFRDNDYHFEEDGGYVYPAEIDEARVALDISVASQTWDAHYMSGKYHDDTVCGYCAEAEVTVG